VLARITKVLLYCFSAWECPTAGEAVVLTISFHRG